jgi:glutamine synthetase
LYEATKALESDTSFIKGLIPSELLGDYLDLKLRQHKESLKGVTGLELRSYFTV